MQSAISFSSTENIHYRHNRAIDVAGEVEGEGEVCCWQKGEQVSTLSLLSDSHHSHHHATKVEVEDHTVRFADDVGQRHPFQDAYPSSPSSVVAAEASWEVHRKD